MKKNVKSKYKFCMVLLDVEGNIIDSEPFNTLHAVSQLVKNLLSRSDYRQIYSVSLFINHNLI